MNARRDSTLGLDRPTQGTGLLIQEVCYDHGRPFGGKHPDAGLADPAGTSRDHYNFVPESHALTP